MRRALQPHPSTSRWMLPSGSERYTEIVAPWSSAPPIG